MRRIVFVLVAFVMALIPAVVAAQDAEDDNGFLLRVNGTVVVPEGEHVDTLIVINGDILIEGTAETVVAIDSDAVIRGAVEDEVVVISGNLELADQSRVNDVVLESSDLQRAPGATPIRFSPPSSPTARPATDVPCPWSSQGSGEFVPQTFAAESWIASCQLYA